MTPTHRPALDGRTLRAIPPGIWALGFVSMLMDISSEMIHALLPVYLVTVLATSATTVGLIEGIAEATASITKVFSGALSDWLGRRKLLAVIGYGLAALTKPVFPLANSVGLLVAARFVDRVGKGIRGAPRDALVADLAPPELRGASFGLRQSLDTIGAFIGPLIAIGLMWLTANDFRTVFWVAVIPACLAVAVLIFGVREGSSAVGTRRIRFPLHHDELRRLDGRYWSVIAFATLFTLARFSEAFLVLRASDIGVPLMLVPLVLVLMNVVYAAASYPAGLLADRGGRKSLLIAGVCLLIAADLTLAWAPGITGLALGLVFWGLQMGLTQGLLATLVADAAPPELRGTAFGLFNFVTGVALLLASVLAGLLWDRAGSHVAFLVGAMLAVLSLPALRLLRNQP